MPPRTTNSRLSAAVAAALFAVVAVVYWTWHSGEAAKPGQGGSGAHADAASAAAQNPDSVELSDSQLDAVKVKPVEERDFPNEKDAVGSIDFNEDMSVQVFTPYQGRIIALFAEVGDNVEKGQTLFTIDSPDLLQGKVDLDRRSRCARPRQQKSRPAARALYDAGSIAARCGAGHVRPTNRRRQSAGGARRGAHLRQERCRYRSHHRSTHCRSDSSSCQARSPAGSPRATRHRDCSCSPATRRRPTW